MRPKRGRFRLRTALLSGGGAETELKLNIILERGLSGPRLPLRVEGSNMTFVLKCKIECALRLLRETYADAGFPTAAAEDIELEYLGVPMRDMMAIDRYGIDSGAEIVAAYAPQPTEKETVPREADFTHLDAAIMAETGVPSTGTIKRIVAKKGAECQMCWRSRWFRAKVLRIYSTSILLGWADWSDAEWPNFFVRVAFATAPDKPPGEGDETWRLRWHKTKATKDLPIVQPRYRELPPLNWVKSFLRTYASADESTMLREMQAQLPRELVARAAAATRHRVLILGASGVGKSTLASVLEAGPPGDDIPTLAMDGWHVLDDVPSQAASAAARRGRYWPTVGPKASLATVHTPGLPPLQLEVWDTSGNPTFKPLSLVFYGQAHSLILMFDVKSMASFKALGATGGWLHEFTRLTGKSPRDFPCILVGNKAEEDVMVSRQVYEEDVRDWLYRDGGRMPYLETSLTGAPKDQWRAVEHVFRTVARTAHRVKENLGRHRPPETVRVPEEPDYAEERAGYGRGPAFDASSFVGSFTKAAQHREGGSAGAPAALASALATGGAELGQKLSSMVRKGEDWAARTKSELLQCVRERLPEKLVAGGGMQGEKGFNDAQGKHGFVKVAANDHRVALGRKSSMGMALMTLQDGNAK